MNLEQRLLRFINCSNWVVFLFMILIAVFILNPAFTRGVVFGGLIVIVNFHFLARTLKKAFDPSNLKSGKFVLLKYYIRFIVTGLLIFLIIRYKLTNPIGLFAGLSVVVLSVVFATIVELRKLFSKEAV